ncbi:hypothetical protein G6F31_016957 [Rhizopus arrhizus]|nr:hypothetical protein G6F31_016957 [Rhizopus arrhizus]
MLMISAGLVLAGMPDTVTATLAQHAHRKHLGLEGDTGHADAVVGLLGHGAGDVRAVPGTVLGQRAVVTLVIVFDPVAIVLRTGYAIIGRAARGLRVADEVVAFQQVADQVRMLRQDAGVDHRHHDALALRNVPRRRRDRSAPVPAARRRHAARCGAASRPLRRTAPTGRPAVPSARAAVRPGPGGPARGAGPRRWRACAPPAGRACWRGRCRRTGWHGSAPTAL